MCVCVCVYVHNSPSSPPEYFLSSVSRRPLEDEIFYLHWSPWGPQKAISNHGSKSTLFCSPQGRRLHGGRGEDTVEAKTLWVASNRNQIWATMGETRNILTWAAKPQEGHGSSWISRITGTGTRLDFLQPALICAFLSQLSVLLDTTTFCPGEPGFRHLISSSWKGLLLFFKSHLKILREGQKIPALDHMPPPMNRMTSSIIGSLTRTTEFE